MIEARPLSTQPKLVRPCLDTIDIAQRLAQGHTQVNIAAKYNVSKQRISQIAKDIKPTIDKYKAILVDEYALKYIDRTITENDKAHAIVNDTYTPNEEDERFLTRQDKKGEKIMTSIGIYASHTNINNFGNIQVNQVNTMISPVVAKAIGQDTLNKLSELSNDEVIDV